MATRRAPGRSPQRRHRAGSVLFGLGCLTVLGGMFAMGILADRYWFGPPTAARAATTSGAGREAPASRPGGRSGHGDDRTSGKTRVAEPAPKLTFYQELTAPLTPPPPRPLKPEKEEKKTDAKIVEKSERAGPGPGRFTVQVGAFRSRPQAEAVKASLTDSGHEAYVSASDGPDGPRYRVRVGAFASRDEAKRAAARLESEAAMRTYVTPR